MTIEYKKIFKFIVSGGIAAFVNLISRWILFHFLPYTVSITIAYILGMLTAFIIFKFFVFDSGQSGKTKKEVLFFILVNIFALIQTLIISVFLAEILFPYIDFKFYPYDIAHIIGVAIPVLSSYLLHKKFTFANIENDN